MQGKGEKKMLRADVYCRVSTQKEAQQDSIIHQQEKGEMVAQELGAAINRVCVDEGKSGTTTKKRTAYQQMVDDIKSKKVNLIITKDVERLNRDLLEFCKFLNLTVQNNVKIYFYLTNEYYDINQDTLIKIRAVLAEDYSKSLSAKAREAHISRQENGRSVIFTNKVWGYNTVFLPDGTKKLIINETEAEMIKIIFNLCIQGFGVHRIAKKLYDLGYLNHNGNMIGKGVIMGILRNPKVMGTAIYNKRFFDFGKKQMIKNPESKWIIKEGIVPEIISPETFMLANYFMDSRTIKGDGAFDERKVIGYFTGCSKLSGKLICGECGATYTRQARKLTNGERVYDWLCGRYLNYGRKTENPYKRKNSQKANVRLKDGCDNPNVKQEVVFNIIKKITEEYFSFDKKLVVKSLGLLKSSMEKSMENDTSKAEMEQLENQIGSLNVKINGLTDKLMEGILTNDTYKNMVEKYEKEREQLKYRLFKLNEKHMQIQTIENRIKEIKSLLNNGGTEEAGINTTLEYIDKIYIFSNRFEITFHMDQLLGIENKELCETVAKEGKLVYHIDKSDMKYKRQAMDKTNEIIYNAIKDDSKVSIAELSEMSGLSRTTVHFRVQRFKQLGYIRHRLEAGRKREWEVLKAWNPDDNQKLMMRPE